METYYKVTYKTKTGLEVSHNRDTVERGYYLYKSLMKDGEENIKLEEISNNGTSVLRGVGCYGVKEEQIKLEEPKSKEEQIKLEEPKSLFEMMFGISKEEYNECLISYNRLTDENIELL